MEFALSPAAAAAGYRLFTFETTSSTTSEAMAAARAGDGGPAWFVAAHQTGGRGRRGNVWHTAPGNLAASLLLSTGLPASTIAQLGFVAGLALARALDLCCERERGDRASSSGMWRTPAGSDGALTPFSLKWPNDVLADGAKLAGILLGTEEVGPGRRAVTIGIGVNVASAPDGLAYPAASLRNLGRDIAAPAVFAALAAAWVEAHAIWDEGRGFGDIRKAWLARAAGLGGPVAVAAGGGAVARGRFETIDGHGQLIIRGPDGVTQAVSAGDVHFGLAASARSEVRP